MTVRELLELLHDLPLNAPVRVDRKLEIQSVTLDDYDCEVIIKLMEPESKQLSFDFERDVNA